MSWSLEGLAPLDPRAVLSIRSASKVLVRTKDCAVCNLCAVWDLQPLLFCRAGFQPCIIDHLDLSVEKQEDQNNIGTNIIHDIGYDIDTDISDIGCDIDFNLR